MKSVCILAAISVSGAFRLVDNKEESADKVSAYPNFLIRKAQEQMFMETHQANNEDGKDNVDQADDKYDDGDISHAFIKASQSTDPKESAEFRKRKAENAEKARLWQQHNDDPTGAMSLKAQLDKERKEMGIFTEEEEDVEDAKSKFRPPN